MAFRDSVTGRNEELQTAYMTAAPAATVVLRAYLSEDDSLVFYKTPVFPLQDYPSSAQTPSA